MSEAKGPSVVDVLSKVSGISKEEMLKIRERVRDNLEGKGYTSEVARIIATNVDYHTKRSAQFYVRSVEIEGDFVGEGNFKITVNYINKIDPKMGEVATGEQKKSGDNATKEQKK